MGVVFFCGWYHLPYWRNFEQIYIVRIKDNEQLSRNIALWYMWNKNVKKIVFLKESMECLVVKGGRIMPLYVKNLILQFRVCQKGTLNIKMGWYQVVVVDFTIGEWYKRVLLTTSYDFSFGSWKNTGAHRPQKISGRGWNVHQFKFYPVSNISLSSIEDIFEIQYKHHNNIFRKINISILFLVFFIY